MSIDPGLIKIYKRRWKDLYLLEQRELGKMTIKQKIHSLDAMRGLYKGLGMNLNDDKDRKEVRLRWLRLKRKFDEK